MPKDSHIELEGVVIQCGAGGIFKVQCDSHVVTARLSGKMRKFRIKIVLDDKVLVSVSPNGPNLGLITFREK